MKRILILLPFLFWMSLSLFEIVSFTSQFRPMYFRAWEYAFNDGLDGYYVPFKPFIHYEGVLTGDLLEPFNFISEKRDISKQIFQADEFGFRNRIGMLKKPIKAVAIGTSWVGGAHETQKNLVSEILTYKYNIPTYNYATQPLQHFWEDARFKSHPPKYVLIIGNETEFLQNHFIETLQNTTITKDITSWKNLNDWRGINDALPLDYPSYAKLFKRFSVTKYFLRQTYLSITNMLFTRAQLASFYGKTSLYDSSDNILFFDNVFADPTESSVLAKNVSPTIKTLITTQNILKTRGITMIVAVMPSKASIQSPEYQKTPVDHKILFKMEQELEKSNIEHINLLEDLSSYVNNTDHLIYFRDDTHWNTYANHVIAQKLAAKIKNIEENQNSEDGNLH